MKLTVAQAKIAIDLHRFRVICCGRRFGKTTLAVEEIKGKALYKPTRIAYIAPTYQQARDIAWDMLKKEMLPITIQTNESRLELKVRTKDNDFSYIWLRGWENIETIRGQQFDFIVIDTFRYSFKSPLSGGDRAGIGNYIQILLKAIKP